jgi:chlorophyll(ide) b reductase
LFSPESVIETVKELQLELEARLYHPFSINNDPLSPKDRNDCPRVIGIACDVSKVDDVKALAEFAGSELGSIDIWVGLGNYRKHIIF